MNKFQAYLKTGLLLAPAFLLGASGAALGATTPQQAACTGSGGTLAADGTCTPSSGGLALFGPKSAFTDVANVLIFVIGAVSILMVIIGGLRYVLSGGDSAGVKGAKDTILYALVGVGVAIIAYAIVNFVISAIK